jgi:hypothetical protein
MKLSPNESNAQLREFKEIVEAAKGMLFLNIFGY